MGGASKRRALTEKDHGSSTGSSGNSRDATERSAPKSIPRLDGNRDPVPTNGGRLAIDYSRPQDLKNISEALGYAGWCVARGVSNKRAPCPCSSCPHISSAQTLPRTRYARGSNAF
jgi:eukaryotic translation initiation factor 2C